MKHIKKFFKNKDRDIDWISDISKLVDLPFRKINENTIIFGPKNNHEITVKLGRSSYMVRPSYMGTYYEEEKETRKLEKYLIEYDFNISPNVTHKHSVEKVTEMKYIKKF